MILRIAQAQINPIVGDIKDNMRKILSQIRLAEAAEADLVTFPELALTGYPPEDLLLRSRFLSDNQDALMDLARERFRVAALVGFADVVDGGAQNAAALLFNGEVVGIYHKMELPNYGVFDEKRYFTPGNRCFVFDLSGVRVSVTICEDIWIPGSITESCAINNSAGYSPEHIGIPVLRREIPDKKEHSHTICKGCRLRGLLQQPGWRPG